MSARLNPVASALIALRPEAAWALRGDDLEWLDAIQTQPTEAEIAAKIAELQQADAVAGYVRAVEAHVEATARSRQYASAVSCASYVTSSNAAWAAEATAFVGWRDSVWAVVYAALAQWQATGVEPGADALVASLPAIVWPE